MNKLIAFDPEILKDVEIFADLKINSELELSFRLSDPQNQIESYRNFSLNKNIQRRNELWKDNCFELFLNPVNEKQYYEFNFSLDAFWNCYFFDEYRKPQPPAPTQDFSLVSISWDKTNFKAQIQNNSGFKKFNIGLTAIVKNKENQTTYFSLQHNLVKPDFHQLNTFILKRG